MNVLFEWIGKAIGRARFLAIVCPWERCVRIRGGKNVAELSTGIHLCWPFYDEIRLFNTRLRTVPVPAQSLTTEDGKSLSLALNVYLRLENPLDALMAFQQPEDSCASFAQTFASVFVESRDLADIDRADLRETVAVELSKVMAGFVIESVGISEYAIPNRTFRVINNEWRPQTRPDAHDVTKMDVA